MEAVLQAKEVWLKRLQGLPEPGRKAFLPEDIPGNAPDEALYPGGPLDVTGQQASDDPAALPYAIKTQDSGNSSFLPPEINMTTAAKALTKVAVRIKESVESGDLSPKTARDKEDGGAAIS
jgi:hypothetical protein